MDLSGDFLFDAPQELTWKALQDPDVLASVMPGGEDFKEIGENEYAGLLNIKVGPVQGKFTGKIKLSDVVDPESYSIQVDGKGSTGFVKANGRLILTDQEGKTRMSYEGHAQVGGRIASVGQRLVETSAKSIIRQSLEGLNEYLKVQVAANQPAEAAGGSANEINEVSDYTTAPRYYPPSQTKVALNLFKDIISDLVPSQYRPLVIAFFAFLVVLMIYRMLRK
jgi:carbon monoxide dehydrogenase subunit G